MQLPLVQIFVPTDGSSFFRHICPERLLPFIVPLVSRQAGLTLIPGRMKGAPPDVEVFTIDQGSFQSTAPYEKE
jgi:hypothetical protein